MSKRLWLPLALLVACLAVLMPATSASAGTLISSPPHKVCKGNHFAVGVWYRKWEGGSRWYRIRVYNPAGHRIYADTGHAPSSHWRKHRIHAKRLGHYKTVYKTRWHGQTYTSRDRTLSHHC